MITCKKQLLHLLLPVALICFTINLNGQGLKSPRAVSPAATLKQTIGLTEITVEYSRPRVTLNGNDRSGKIWGQQVAYGFNKVGFGSGNPIPWRAGANENTIITFSNDVKIEGKDLAAGQYGLHMEIKEDGGATVIFSKNSSSWGSFFYDEKEDALRVSVTTEKVPHTEVLTYDFVDMGKDYGVLALSWEEKRIPFKVSVDIHDMVLQSFRDQLRSTAGFGPQGFTAAARYCMNENINHEEAIGWIDQALNQQKGFNGLMVKSGLLAQQGKTSEAMAMSDEAAQIANMGQLNFLGYQMLGQKQNQKAIEYFQLNVKRNPTNANVHDSLGEAYKINGDDKLAIKSLKKSLSLNPPANVKANSIKLLKELGIEYQGT
ncbi:DUF2911 domain-containing protein [Fulvivirgaceae bacterium BMA10]|uniref:DUF2911 domain-containing protein n=1 Tax=Splendidivirga corallicola TaxID=3051826 RepID=A0ABT8KZD3_9BACT|nr:DUF2911 domain-containing protein [Fulvivirgaceae bacterium BMA10]